MDSLTVLFLAFVLVLAHLLSDASGGGGGKLSRVPVRK
jgi:hypothetical protein